MRARRSPRDIGWPHVASLEPCRARGRTDPFAARGSAPTPRRDGPAGQPGSRCGPLGRPERANAASRACIASASASLPRSWARVHRMRAHGANPTLPMTNGGSTLCGAPNPVSKGGGGSSHPNSLDQATSCCVRSALRTSSRIAENHGRCGSAARASLTSPCPAGSPGVRGSIGRYAPPTRWDSCQPSTHRASRRNEALIEVGCRPAKTPAAPAPPRHTHPRDRP